MAITLPDARQLSDDVLEALRLRALNGRERGFTEADLANLLGVSRETVCRWWSAYAAHGIDALPTSGSCTGSSTAASAVTRCTSSTSRSCATSAPTSSGDR